MVVVGGGIVGLATARAVLARRPGLALTLLEKEPALARHQSGRNSGVIHTGIYYRPGSLKARMTTTGREALIALCRHEGVAVDVCGKVVVATDAVEHGRLRALRDRAVANGIEVRMLGPAGLADLEPHAAGVAAMHVPGAAVVDFVGVCHVLARDVAAAGGDLRLGTAVLGVDGLGVDGPSSGGAVVRTGDGDLEARAVVICAGLHADRLVPGHRPSVRIVPFRGEYYDVVPGRDHLVRHMVYPVPDPDLPFLGVHFTRSVDGRVHAGPNAVLALAREGYSWRAVDPRHIRDLVAYPGFRRLVAAQWRTGLGEMHRSLRRSVFVGALRRLVPAIEATDLVPARSGVRAQAVDTQGRLLDDFAIHESGPALSVLNAPSPAATACLEIGDAIAAKVVNRLG